MHIRDAVEADLPAILHILAESGIDGDASFTLDEARAHFARIRTQQGFRLLVADDAGEVVGTYVLQIMQKLGKRGTPAGVVEDIAVLPARHGQGIGRAMMQHACDACRAAGCYKLALSSNVKREDAHRFYDSLGFERHGFSFVTRF